MVVGESKCFDPTSERPIYRYNAKIRDMTIDWDATGAMLQGWGSLLQGLGSIAAAVAVGVGAIVGANTYNNWRQQKLAERKMDHAEKILTSTYKARRSLSRLRSPAMWAHETDTAEKRLKESGEWDKAFGDEDKKRLAYAQAYYLRLEVTQPDQAALEDCQPIARALFGEPLEKALKTLAHQFWTVRVYVDANHRDKKDGDPDFRRKIESTIWEGYPSEEENYLDKIIAAEIKIIEDICVPVLRDELNKN